MKVPPRSVYYPRTNELIDAVFKYDDAMTFVANGDAHPDGHDRKENTLLTEAVKRFDYQAASFALKSLQCSADTSCDCPLHNTALHYAIASVNTENDPKTALSLIKLLLDHGARVNLINSVGQTLLDIAKHQDNRQILIIHGGLAHRTGVNSDTSIYWLRRIFDYRSDERTLIEASTRDKHASPTIMRRS